MFPIAWQPWDKGERGLQLRTIIAGRKSQHFLNLHKDSSCFLLPAHALKLALRVGKTPPHCVLEKRACCLYSWWEPESSWRNRGDESIREGRRERKNIQAGDLICLPRTFTVQRQRVRERPEGVEPGGRPSDLTSESWLCHTSATTLSPSSQFLDLSGKKGTAVLNLQGCYDRVCAIPHGGGRGVQ